MHEFLELNVAFRIRPAVTRILDQDLNRHWITSACDHVRRRGYTLHLLTSHIRERAGNDPDLAGLHWTHVRDCILGRDIVGLPDPIALESHVRALVGTPLSVALAS
jgi:hypothetical protein